MQAETNKNYFLSKNKKQTRKQITLNSIKTPQLDTDKTGYKQTNSSRAKWRTGFGEMNQ